MNDGVKEIDNVIVVAPKIFTQLIRYFPLVKVFWSFLVFIWVLRKNKVKPSFIIAHNLWSDGMLAWLYHKFTGTPYTVAVRNTDINLFLPKMTHYRWLMRRIVRDAKRTVFINKAYVERINGSYPSLFDSIKDFKVIYNGIDEQWFRLANNEYEGKQTRKLQVVYVGSFLPNKNLKNSLLALEQLNNKGHQISFVAVGGTEAEFLNCTAHSELPDWVTIIPKTRDRKLIARHLQSSRVFVMPSFHETFGLVYIEALSQGCSLVHSQNEGIDGVFNEPFIKSVDPYNVNDIANKIESLTIEFSCGVAAIDVKRLTSDFSWLRIAEQYLEIINEGIIQ